MAYTQFQLWALFGLGAVIGFSFEIIFPFVNQFLLEIGAVDDPKDVGYYSGVVESAFAFSQLVTVFPSTWLADKYGRKPVVIWSAVIVGISMILFAFSKTFLQLVFSRILGGVEGASSTCLRVIATEIATKETEAHVFTVLGISYRVGQILGQPIGGTLSHPERHWPKLFSAPFWYAYPYALPCFVAAGYALVCAVFGQIVLKETLPAKSKAHKKTKKGSDVRVSVVEVDEADESASERTPLLSPTTSVETVPTPTPTYRSLLNWKLVSFLVSQAAMVLLTEILFATYPLFAFTNVDHGGLGLSEAEIGYHMAMRSIFCLVVIIPFTWIEKKFGKMRVYQFSLFALWQTTLFFPFLNQIARDGGKGGVLWNATLFLLWTVWATTTWAWTAVYMISSSIVPNAEAMARVQGIVSACLIAPQALAPALGTSTFAFSLKHSEILGGNLFWIGVFIVGTLTFLQSLTLKETTHDWRSSTEDSE